MAAADAAAQAAPLPLLALLRHWWLWLRACVRCLLPGAPQPRAVRLDGLRLAALPRRLPAAAARLDASRNRVANLPRQLAWHSLRSLDLSRNQLTALPDALCDLVLLEELNLAHNALTVLPEQIGRLRRLRTLGLRSNALTALPDSVGQLSCLESLYLTDNALSELPRTLGGLRALRKLQAATNALTALPDELAQLPQLEMLRVPCNRLTRLPPGLGRHPTLTWLSLAGNPVCPPPDSPAPSTIPEISAAELDYPADGGGGALGAGASGGAFAAVWRDARGAGVDAGGCTAARPVVVKRFVEGISPDGAPADEVAAACAVAAAPRCVRVLALQRQPCLALVMAPAQGVPLGGRPGTPASPLLRCFYSGVFAPRAALAAGAHVAAALAACHAARVAHGDVYAHNVLLHVPAHDGAGAAATLCDFGAAFGYGSIGSIDGTPVGIDFERLEVRAFGLLLLDLAEHVERTRDGRGERAATALRDVGRACCGAQVAARPPFALLAAQLDALLQSC